MKREKELRTYECNKLWTCGILSLKQSILLISYIIRSKFINLCVLKVDKPINFAFVFRSIFLEPR